MSEVERTLKKIFPPVFGAILLMWAADDLSRGQKVEDVLFASMWRLVGMAVIVVPFLRGLGVGDKLAHKAERAVRQHFRPK